MLKRLASFFTYLMRHYLPDAYLFAILLTFLSAILALIFTSVGFTKVITTWGAVSSFLCKIFIGQFFEERQILTHFSYRA